MSYVSKFVGDRKDLMADIYAIIGRQGRSTVHSVLTELQNPREAVIRKCLFRLVHLQWISVVPGHPGYPYVMFYIAKTLGSKSDLTRPSPKYVVRYDCQKILRWAPELFTLEDLVRLAPKDQQHTKEMFRNRLQYMESIKVLRKIPPSPGFYRNQWTRL